VQRFAVYFLPAEEAPLARLGRDWLGWDVHRGMPSDSRADVVKDWTESPRIYGFHATLKPPFRLAEGQSAEALADAVRHLAALLRPVELGRLALSDIGSFLALAAPDAGPDLARLAAECVRTLDGFRAPLTEKDLARRRAAGLDTVEDGYLMQWGYPYVMDRFRFHMTLTGRLEPAMRVQARRTAEEHFAPVQEAPLALDAISLVEQPDAGASFRLVQRFMLGGSESR
jgi:putative phosphonate metabolism protein